MAALILSSISKEMMEIDGTSVLKALSTYYSNRHNENMSALVNVLDAYVSFNSETVQLQNSSQGSYTLNKYLRVSLQLSSWIIIFLNNFSVYLSNVH